MVYSRTGRPSKYFEGKTRHGWKQVCTLVSDKKLAQRIEHMWAELAGVRAWDLLDPVIADGRKIGALYDRWTATKQDVAAMRLLARDVDVTAFVSEWNAVMKTQVGTDWTSHALVHVRAFFPVGVERLTSECTPDWLTTTLSTYPGKRNTRRKVHASLSVFFDYLTVTKRLFPANPMALVDRPKQEFTLPVFYDAMTVKRIVNRQPTAERKAVMALIYGAGADVTPAVEVERDDVNAATKEVRIRGTKTAFRDRVVRVSDAMWPTFWAYAKTVLSGRILPDMNRWTASDWHRDAVKGLDLKKKLPLRKARHHFAVRLLESGASIRVVSEQLGTDERTVLKHYGPWITSSEDRARAEKMAGKHETKRREAK